MSEFIEWVPKHHGHQPLHWKPDMLTSVDGKSFVRQPNWAWIAGSVYYVPHEAVGVVREDVEPEPEQTDELVARLRKYAKMKSMQTERPHMVEVMTEASDRIEVLTAEVEWWRGMLEMVLRESVDIECGDRILYAGTVNDIRAALEKQP
jgi:hypothetical protein